MEIRQITMKPCQQQINVIMSKTAIPNTSVLKIAAIVILVICLALLLVSLLYFAWSSMSSTEDEITKTATAKENQNGSKTLFTVVSITAAVLAIGALIAIIVGNLPKPKHNVDLVKSLFKDKNEKYRLIVCRTNDEKEMQCEEVNIPETKQTKGGADNVRNDLKYCSFDCENNKIALCIVDPGEELFKGLQENAVYECSEWKTELTSWIKKYDPDFVDFEAME